MRLVTWHNLAFLLGLMDTSYALREGRLLHEHLFHSYYGHT